ncbi:unnamed protein product [Musa hybrid cultivar]
MECYEGRMNRYFYSEKGTINEKNYKLPAEGQTHEEIGAVLLLESVLPELLPDPLHLRDLLGRAQTRVELPHLPSDVVVVGPQPRAAALRDLEPPHCRTQRGRRETLFKIRSKNEKMERPTRSRNQGW